MGSQRKERRRRERIQAKGQRGPDVPIRAPGWWVWVVVLIVGAVYVNSLDGPFVYDDRLTVVGNASIRHLDDPVALVLVDIFRPVVNASYALNYAISGLNPRSYHVTNVLLHMMNVGLLVLCVRRLARGQDPTTTARLSLLTALVYGVHPMLTEAVSYVSGRSELLCTLFALVSLVLFVDAVRSGGWGRWFGAWVAFVLALGSKETSAVVPFVLAAAEWFGLLGDEEGRHRRWLRLHLPFSAVVLLAGLARVAVYLRVEQTGQAVGLWHNALTEATVFWRYLGLAVVPVGQSIMHPVTTIDSPWDPVGLVALLGIVGAVVAALVLGRRAPLPAFGFVWFTLFFAPSHVIPLQEAMAEHRVSTAMAGLVLAVVFGLWSAAERFGGWSADRVRISMVVAVLTVAALAGATVARNRVWSDPVTLWGDAAVKAPDTWGAQYAFADALRNAGRCDDAVPVYRRAVALLPGEISAHLNLGICLAEIGEYDEARGAFHAAAALDPSDPRPHTNLGTPGGPGRSIRRGQGPFGASPGSGPGERDRPPSPGSTRGGGLRRPGVGPATVSRGKSDRSRRPQRRAVSGSTRRLSGGGVGGGISSSVVS
jgi:tetratricopeptide (TPR) repeat protein